MVSENPITNIFEDLETERVKDPEFRAAAEDPERMETALELWKRWFEYSGDPWEYFNPTWGLCCFFCGEFQPGHEPDCIYVAAKKLVEHKADD